MNRQIIKKSLFLILLVFLILFISSGCELLDDSEAKAEAIRIHQQKLEDEQREKERKEREAKKRRIEKKKKKLESKLERVESKKKEAETELSKTKQKLESLKTGIGELNTSIQNRRNSTVKYLEEHSLAVGCLAAFGYSIGNDNHFSDDVNGLIGAASIFCAAGALLDEEFGREVVAVIDTIKESDKLIKKWQSQIKASRLAIIGGLEVKKEEEAIVETISEEIEEIEDKIEGLETF